MPLWRCKTCKSEFEAAAPACAACGYDPAADPRAERMFDLLELIHFDPPSAIPGCGVGRAACDPKAGYGGRRRFTAAPAAVTCAACKATAAFNAADADGNGIRAALRVGPIGEN